MQYYWDQVEPMYRLGHTPSKQNNRNKMMGWIWNLKEQKTKSMLFKPQPSLNSWPQKTYCFKERLQSVRFSCLLGRNHLHLAQCDWGQPAHCGCWQAPKIKTCNIDEKHDHFCDGYVCVMWPNCHRTIASLFHGYTNKWYFHSDRMECMWWWWLALAY